MHSYEAEGISLDARPDGIYLILDNTKPKDRSIIKNPMKVLEGTGIDKINIETLLKAFANKDERVEEKISNQTTLRIADDEVSVTFSKDFMEARISIIPGHPWFGKNVDVGDIKKALAEQGVKYGLLTEVVSQFAADRPKGTTVTAAVGKSPINGKNGYLNYHFDYETKNNKPKILDDGRVDYRDTNYVLKANKGDILVEIVDPEPGIDGVNVKGEVIPFKPGKPGPRLPRGKNASIIDNDMKLVSDLDGQIVIENGRVSVIPVLEIRGDVGNETGNIDFSGSVYVEGVIHADFIVKAGGSVDVKGAVEGGHIEAGGDINLIGGIKGMGKSIIRAGGDIFARYAERSFLISDGDITCDSIMHSDVKCRMRLILDGKNGLLVGGHIYAGKSVTAKTIGSNMATYTEITVGSSPDLLDRYKELEATYNKTKEDYEKERLIESFKAGNEDMRLRSLHARIHLRVEMDKVQKEMNDLLAVLDSNEGIIRASQVIHSGCKVLVGGVLLKVRDDIPACSLRNVDGKVEIGSYIAYN